MKNIADELRQREAETEKLKQTLRNTPPSDPAYVRISVGSCRVYLAQSLGLIIARGRCLSGHVVQASLSRIRHRNSLTEETWEDTVQGLGKSVSINATVFG